MISENITIAAAAVLLDLILGDPHRIPHPIAGIGRLITIFEKWIRGMRLNGRIAGLLLFFCVTTFSSAAAYTVVLLASFAGESFRIALSAVIGYFCLAARSLHVESGKVATFLIIGDLESARKALSMIVGRDTEFLTEQEIWRALFETVSENISDAVIAPLLFLIAGGPVAAIFYKAVNTLDSMVGYRNEKYISFGWASARMDDLMNFIPARVTAFLIALCAPLFGFSGIRSAKIIFRDARNHLSPNSGFPEAAAAGAVGVRIGGTNSYFGEPVEKPTIGDPLYKLDEKAWIGAVKLMYSSEILLLSAAISGGFLV